MDKKQIKKIINNKLIDYGLTKMDLAIQMMISPASLYNKISNPDSFKLKELKLMADVLHFTSSEKLTFLQ
jgi:hypothetical protein